MDIGTIGWIEKIKEKKLLPDNLGRVLEIGSLDINGSAKQYFNNYSEYIGIDMQEGKGVDVVMNAHDLDLEYAPNYFDTIICLNTFEHDNKFWLTLDNINLLLKSNGHLIFCEPTYTFPIHRHPKDYWRILPDALQEVIFEGYKILDWEEVYSKKVDDPTYRKGWKGINPILCGLGRKI